jgi:ubiquinone/menaquinone biosynthesis C-methylase UbiE
MPDASFDRALALNTIYFWQEPGQDLREIRRVLRPGGKLVLGAVAPRSTVGRAIFDQGFKLYEQDQIEALLRAAGFDDVRIDTVTETVMMANGEWTRDYHLACAI